MCLLTRCVTITCAGDGSSWWSLAAVQMSGSPGTSWRGNQGPRKRRDTGPRGFLAPRMRSAQGDAPLRIIGRIQQAYGGFVRLLSYFPYRHQALQTASNEAPRLPGPARAHRILTLRELASDRSTRPFSGEPASYRPFRAARRCRLTRNLASPILKPWGESPTRKTRGGKSCPALPRSLKP